MCKTDHNILNTIVNALNKSIMNIIVTHFEKADNGRDTLYVNGKLKFSQALSYYHSWKSKNL